ncbi:hypothetical protein PTH_2763 [Pelotomaculum thermopropionicum SI]|uniref:Uncharacterized protein n=1 Tax=Pelotomaculum thermopropionicum (strain DSM 13744 / JCM 10971 / SI) TaxID=370438 RepID=A5CYK1_PELTS|nr:hypothetical protein PTH_2763 [Pelotomaculum thermopropionicum SI]
MRPFSLRHFAGQLVGNVLDVIKVVPFFVHVQVAVGIQAGVKNFAQRLNALLLQLAQQPLLVQVVLLEVLPDNHPVHHQFGGNALVFGGDVEVLRRHGCGLGFQQHAQLAVRLGYGKFHVADVKGPLLAQLGGQVVHRIAHLAHVPLQYLAVVHHHRGLVGQHFMNRAVFHSGPLGYNGKHHEQQKAKGVIPGRLIQLSNHVCRNGAYYYAVDPVGYGQPAHLGLADHPGDKNHRDKGANCPEKNFQVRTHKQQSLPHCLLQALVCQQTQQLMHVPFVSIKNWQ